jgi:hypothetical protein
MHRSGSSTLGGARKRIAPSRHSHCKLLFPRSVLVSERPQSGSRFRPCPSGLLGSPIRVDTVRHSRLRRSSRLGRRVSCLASAIPVLSAGQDCQPPESVCHIRPCRADGPGSVPACLQCVRLGWSLSQPRHRLCTASGARCSDTIRPHVQTYSSRRPMVLREQCWINSGEASGALQGGEDRCEDL